MLVQFSAQLGNEAMLCIGAITREQAELAGLNAKGGDIGYFLYERHIDDGEESLTILAKFHSDEAAERIAQIFASQAPLTPAY